VPPYSILTIDILRKQACVEHFTVYCLTIIRSTKNNSKKRGSKSGTTYPSSEKRVKTPM
jgi:hypothetical protein